MFLASFFYADLCLLAPSRSALQWMIQTRANYCKTNGLSFNPNISKIMIFSKTSIDFDLIAPIYLNGLAIDCTEKIKYLGTTIMSKSGLSFLQHRNYFHFTDRLILFSMSLTNPMKLHKCTYFSLTACQSYLMHVQLKSFHRASCWTATLQWMMPSGSNSLSIGGKASVIWEAILATNLLQICSLLPRLSLKMHCSFMQIRSFRLYNDLS